MELNEIADQAVRELILNRFSKEIKENFVERKLVEDSVNKLFNEINELNKKLKDIEGLYYDLKSTNNEIESELSSYKKYHLFQNNDFYEDYVFGDSLPEMKLLYNFLYVNHLYTYSWGVFCHSLQVKASFKLLINISSRDWTNEDIGLLLYKFKDFYVCDNLTFRDWVLHSVQVVSSNDNSLDMAIFYKKYVREYKNTYKLPKNAEIIDKIYLDINKPKF